MPARELDIVLYTIYNVPFPHDLNNPSQPPHVELVMECLQNWTELKTQLSDGDPAN